MRRIPLSANRLRSILLVLVVATLTSSCASCSKHEGESATSERSTTTEPGTDGASKDSEDRDRAARSSTPTGDGRELEHFFQSLKRIEDDEPFAAAKILRLGDSHTASDTATGRMRTLLQDRFGDGGRGLAHPGMPWEYFRQEQMVYGMDGAWDVYRVLYEESPGPWSVGGVRLVSSDPGAILTRRTCDECRAGKSFDQFTVHYLKQPGGGSFDIELDGEKIASIDTGSAYEEFASYATKVEEAPHTLRIRVNEKKPVAIFAMSTRREAGGIVHNALGINGAQAKHYLRSDPGFTQQAVRDVDPDLIMVALGPNEAFDSDYQVEDPDAEIIGLLEKLERYRDQYRRLIRRLKAGAPDASCVVLLPPDLKERRGELPCYEWQFGPGPIDTPLCITPPPYNYGGIINAQRHAAALEGCVTYDQQRAMGGEGSFAIWQQLGLAQWDGIHFTDAGYDLLADNLYSDLMSAYERWLQGKDPEFSASIIFPSLTTTAQADESTSDSATRFPEQR